MGANGIAGLFSVNGSVTNLGGESRQLRLPGGSPFPKLDRAALQRKAPRAQPGGVVVLRGELADFPEMASDVLGVDAGYAMENVKRDRSEVRAPGKLGLAQLMGRMLGGGQSAARL